MKKIMIMAAAAVSLFAFGACSGNKTTDTAKATGQEQCTDNNCVKNGTCSKDVERTYTGILPAADTEGIRYTLKIDYDDDYCKKGDYDLIQTYLVADSKNPAGYKDGDTFKSEGDFTVINGEGANSGKTYLKLVSDKKDDPVMYFMIDSDSTVTMVGDDLQPAAGALNYTLTLTK
ncbi:MAG: copper resistance protein NlpE N-terminal domain-containing protein [Bacteroidales bacterium]|nr:copper resistance protein NlpE N-terminal domain-containing protein [Bacteroidales bacterium]